MTATAPLTPSSTIQEVHFQGGRGGTASATWGQSFYLRQTLGYGTDAHVLNLVLRGGVEPGVPVSAALELLRTLVTTHESLRTTIHVDDGALVQRLHPAGTIRVRVEHQPTRDAAATRADELCAELWKIPFDAEGEFPLRVALVVVNGLVHQSVIVLSHLAVDGVSAKLLSGQIVAGVPRVTGGDRALSRASALQPLDEAAQQQSDVGRRHDQRARERTLDRLRTAPPPMFPRSDPDRFPPFRYRKAVLRSETAHTALETLAKRLGTTRSTVMLAAAVLALAEATDRDDCVLRILVNNRFLPGLSDTVAPIAMDTIFDLDDIGLDADFADVVRRAWKRSLSVFRSAYCDPTQLHASIMHAGLPLHDACRYNDHLELGPGAWEYAHDVPAGEIVWSEHLAQESDDRAICVDIHDAGTAIDLTCIADLNRVPIPLVEQVLRRVETRLASEVTQVPMDSGSDLTTSTGASTTKET